MPSGYAFRRLWRCSHVAAAAIWGAMWKTVPDVMRVSCADPRKRGGVTLMWRFRYRLPGAKLRLAERATRPA